MWYYANKTELSQQASMCQKWLKTRVNAFENSNIFRGDSPRPHYKGEGRGWGGDGKGRGKEGWDNVPFFQQIMLATL
jgi:hypothetical protein